MKTVSDGRALSSLSEGERALFKGRIAVEVWQHPIASIPDHPHVTYVDLSGSQVVVYSKAPMAGAGDVEFTGVPRDSFVNPKRPGESGTFRVRQILAD